jgi:hypothetical protein
VPDDEIVNVRYLVDDVAACVDPSGNLVELFQPAAPS